MQATVWRGSPSRAVTQRQDKSVEPMKTMRMGRMLTQWAGNVDCGLLTLRTVDDVLWQGYAEFQFMCLGFALRDE
jgi:hypothetical protein